MTPVFLAALLGLLAGGITTVAGMGGGVVLLAALSVLFDPHTAIAWTAPALLLGNAHRAWLYRSAAHWPSVGAVSLGTVPASLAGGFLAAALPPSAVALAILGIGLLGLVRALGWLSWRPSVGQTVPLGALGGLLTAAGGGGAGVIVGPVLLARGLLGLPYVATMAWTAVFLHASRLLAYGLGGLADGADLVAGLLLACTIALGNLAGDRLRRRLGEGLQGRVQVGALGLCVVMAAAAVVG